MLLSLIIAIPLLAALSLFFVPRNAAHLYPILARGATCFVFALSVLMFFLFPKMPSGEGGFKFHQKVEWAESLGIHYQVGIDGINVCLILMGSAVALAASFACWEIVKRQRDFYFLFLLMVGGAIGAFASLDVFFFYFFHELALVPTFIMIGIWGKGERRNHATFKITIYLSLGAMLALIGLIALYFQSGMRSFDMIELTQRFAENPIPAERQRILFPLLLFGFGILVSLWPLHTWAPLAYDVAPTATAMLHAGILKKFGLYGLIRLAIPILPEGMRAWLDVLCFLALGNLLYCGWMAMQQRDLKLLIGNSSIAHMGMAFLGIASLSLIGVAGAIFIMVAHGILVALSFGISGYLQHEKGTTQIDKLNGLFRQIPFVGICLFIAMIAACGVPGFANFPGEILILFGAWERLPGFVVAGAWGALIIGAIYCLRAIRNILHGPFPKKLPQKLRLLPATQLPFLLLIGLLILFGICPRLLTDKITQSTKTLIEQANGIVENVDDFDDFDENASTNQSNRMLSKLRSDLP